MKQTPVEVEDEGFLSQIAAMEADALSATKRRKLTPAEPEGAYISVLRGSKSLAFQQQFTKTSNTPFGDNNNNSNISSVGSSGDMCFKCGKTGHWARDCGSNTNTNTNSVGVGVNSSVPEKACACGLGTCLVLTANTEKNRGRKFYRCPQRQENGGCGFFEWCDKPLGTDNTAIRSQSYSINPSIPELSCPCGAGSCLVLTAKTGKNIGQQFYRCPASQGSCGFFKWCNDQTAVPALSDSFSTSKTYKNNYNETGNKNYGASGSCFKCGKDGHWSRDCPQSSFISTPDLGGGKNASSNTCYKCGNPGHWAKDCSSTANTKGRFGQY